MVIIIKTGNCGNVISRQLLVLLLVISLITTVAEGATGTVDFSSVQQELEGFGASGCFYTNFMTSHHDKNTVYNKLFSQLGLDIFRVRNTYDYSTAVANDTVEMVGAAKSRNPNIKIMMSSWTPPTYLKSNNSLRQGTLKKDIYGDYMYDEFADWWYESIDYYHGRGVDADYVSIQNEPDFETNRWETCRFNAWQSTDIAGYNYALEAVYQELDYQMAEPPKLIAPEVSGFYGLGSYINALFDVNQAYGYCHHLYSGGGDANNPDGFETAMTNFALEYGYKPLMQTEYAKDGTVAYFSDALNLAVLMHNALVWEEVSVYIYWELFWDTPKGLVSLPGYGAYTYTINPVYYAFKHYSWFTDPGWHRVESSSSTTDLRITAFKNPEDDEMTIVIVNKSSISVSLTLTVDAFSVDSSEVYRSTSGTYWSYVGTFNPSMSLPAESITTIHLIGESDYSTCFQVLSAGYRLYSDIYPDCHVDFYDVDVIVRNWLLDDCAGYDNCNGADFEVDGDVDFVDFSMFAPQWMQCNDPEDPGCIPNW